MNVKFFLKFLFVLIISLFATITNSQNVTGYVVEKSSLNPLEYVTLSKSNTNKSIATTDSVGKFNISIASFNRNDKLIFSYSGYENQEVDYSTLSRYAKLIPSSKKDPLIIKLKLKTLEEIKYVSKYTIEYIILRQIIKRKKKNDYNYNVKNYFANANSVTEIDISDFERSSLSILKKFKELDFFTSNIDTLKSTNLTYLPLYLTESFYDVYHQHSPKRERRIVKALNDQFQQSESIVSSIFQFLYPLNIYKNKFLLFDKVYTSPIADKAYNFYAYKLIDTHYTKEGRIIQMQFAPRTYNQELFKGSFWYVDSVYAIKKIILKQTDNTQLNFVKDFVISQNYSIENNKWVLSNQNFISEVNFDVADRKKSHLKFLLRRNMYYRNYDFNKDYITQTLEQNIAPTETILEEGYRDKSEEFWIKNKPYVLSKRQQKIYELTDSLQKTKVYNFSYQFLTLLATGYYKISEKFFIGRWFSLFFYNPLERPRFNISFASTDGFSQKFHFESFVGYSPSQPDAIKGRLNMVYYFRREPISYLEVSILRDYTNRLTSDGRILYDNAILRLIPKPKGQIKFTDILEFRAFYLTPIQKGFSIGGGIRYTSAMPLTVLPTKSQLTEPGANNNQFFNNFFVFLNLQYSYNEKYLLRRTRRNRLPNLYPKIDFTYSKSIKGILNNPNDFDKISFSVAENVNIDYVGRINAIVRYQQVFGNNIPYYFLPIPTGNDFLAYNNFFFNTMASFEYIFDQYFEFIYNHNFGQGLFQFIPFLRKLNWNQVANVKLAYGTISDGNKAFNESDVYTFSHLNNNIPFIEAGVGIGNIFKLFRVSWVWRLTNRLKGDGFFTNQFPMFSVHITF